jgi:hypothetical protein
MAKSKKTETAELTVLEPEDAGIVEKTGLIEAPEDAVSVQALSPAAALFLKEAVDRRPPPRKIPIVSIDHQGELFILPTGECVQEISGFPVYVFQTRKFYKKPPVPGESGKPPDCWSANLIFPHEDSLEKQSKECFNCPHARFGTGRDGRSQACGVQTWVFLVNSAFGGNPPLAVLIAPPSSIKALFGNRFGDPGYFGRATQKHEAFEIVWTTFALKRAGDLHCVLEPRMGAAITDLVKVKALVDLRNKFREFMEKMRDEAATVDTPDDDRGGEE